MISKISYSQIFQQLVLAILIVVSLFFLTDNANAQNKKICSNLKMDNQSPQERVYDLGDLLMTTDLFDLYGRLAIVDECWCHYSNVDAVVVYKRDENYKIEDNDEYKNQVENVIVPFIRSKCGDFKFLSVTHHVRGYYLDYRKGVLEGKELQEFLNDNSAQSQSAAYLDYVIDNGKLNRRFVPFESVSGRKKGLLEAKVKAEESKVKEARIAEETRKASIEKRRPIHRKLAADVLKIMNLPSANNPPPTYDFSSYRNKYAWENIYIGNFKPFIGKYEEENDYANAVARSISTGDFVTAYNLANLRSGIIACNYAYHRAYEDICQTNKEIPWIKVSLSVPERDITDGFANKIGKSPKMTAQRFIRVPFVESVSDGFDYMNNSDRAVSDAVFEQLKTEMTTFITAEKCSSPALRKFEVNLYLAERWFLPLQELYQPEQMSEPTPKVNSSTVNQPKKSEINNSTIKTTPKPKKKIVRRKS